MTAMYTEIHPYCRVSYWNGNTAAKPDENWTHCRIDLFGLYPNSHEFTNPRDRDRFLSFMYDVFERGRNAAKEEIRKVLGVKEPR